MKKSTQTFIAIVFPLLAIGQRINHPTWTNEITEFKAAKIRIHDTKTKTSPLEQYKDSKITLKSIYDGEVSTITIDIPDKFYIKEGRVIIVSYEKKEDGTESIIYTIEEGDKLAMMAIYWDLFEDTPKRIFITYNEQTGKTVKSSGSFTIFEFKE